MRRVADPRQLHRRPAAILLVVLLMLSLFAIVGISFVLYAESAATASRIAREAESSTVPDVSPRLLLSYFLGQLVYDADDQTGIDSGLRGHSLGRLAYGWDPDRPQGNDTPFNGTGRLHEPVVFSKSGNPTSLDGYNLINYVCFRSGDGSLLDGLARDPERLGQRSSLQQPPGPYTGGFNAPYTYPDLNNVYLAAVRGDGQVLLPSYHRPWTGFGPLGWQNPNWYDTSKPWLKYLVLRPRPADMAAGFPAPESDGGDVKNLVDSPGGNDSIWLDLGYPVMQAPADGRLFKPLFAPLVVDLDNRINLNVHGNAQGAGSQGRPHLSNQGWGPWEMNPSWVLQQGNEWPQVLLGATPPSPPGRYGADGKPGSAGTQAAFGPRPHSYAQVDFDAADNGGPTAPFALAGFGAPPLLCFPLFPAGYGNASGGPGGERWEHPALTSSLRPRGDDRRFRWTDVEALLRQGQAGPWIVSTDLHRFLPLTIQQPRLRGLLTTHSCDLDRPGLSPWLFDRDTSAYHSPLGSPGSAPSGPAIPFPSLAQRFAASVPTSSDFRTPDLPAGDPSVDWRFADSGPARVDLNRFLPPYPHQGQGLDPAAYSAAPLAGYASRFDARPEPLAQARAALAARQRLADDVYRRLLVVTGVATPANPALPTDAELLPRRWLAQLAANIVDFLDEDEISTPFNFYTAADAGVAAFDAGAVSAGNLDLPRYWVFGTELPRVVLNEVLAEYRLPPEQGPGQADVRAWVELFNPLPVVPPSQALQPLDRQPVPLFIGAGAAGYSPYRVVLANTNTNAGGPLLPRPSSNDNVLGAPDVARVQTTDADFMAAAQPGVSPQGFLVLGPSAPGDSPTLPEGTPVVLSPGLGFPALFTPPNTLIPDYRRSGLTILLRRLANPYLPPDPRPVVGKQLNPDYNPYQTVDYLSGIPLQDAGNPAAIRASLGKRQPYAADPSQIAPQQPSTFGRPNSPLPLSGHYDWLVHLDRPLISPMELLQVSGYPPHLLTQRFICPDGPLTLPRPFNHRVPWFDQENRLYRIFELLSTMPRMAGAAPGGRIPGKVNINTIWDPEMLLALCDPQPGNHFTAEQVNTIFGRLLALRSSLGVPGPADKPFLGMAAPHCPAPGDPQYPAEKPPLFPGGSGIEDTLLRSADGGGATAPRLFEIAEAPHPYLRFELLSKLFNNVTTRSNVFAVWLTVAFFEVKDPSTHPVKLGPELGREEGRHRRHRMFAIVDRTQLSIFSTSSQTAVALPPGQAEVEATVTPAQMAGVSGNGRAWGIQPGMMLTVDDVDNEETVVVTSASPTTFTARFRRPHAAGFSIVQRGNPGPWPGFTPEAQPGVVPYWRVID